VLAENNEIFDAQDIFSILDVPLFDLHKNINFVEGQLHVLGSRFYYLDRHYFFVLVIVSLNYFSESPASQFL
jgi:hypothetical protein